MKSVVLIKWKDVSGLVGWQSEQDCLDLELDQIYTIGFLVGETETTYIVSATHDVSEDNFDSAIAIPKSTVDEIQECPWENAWDASNEKK